MKRYLYVLQKNDRFPDPAEVVSALSALCDEGLSTALLLSKRQHPPLSAARRGDEVLLAIRASSKDQLVLLARAIVADAAREESTTPAPLEPLYGAVRDRYFLPLADVEPTVPRRFDELPARDLARFLSGAGTGPSRSRIPEQADHRFRSKPITDSGASRSLNA